MKKNIFKVCILFIIVLTMFSTIVGCSARDNTSVNTSKQTQASTKKDPIKIKYPSYQVGTNSSAPTEVKLINDFKAMYGSEIEVIVEELPSDQTYLDKMKVLAASGDMPDVVEGKAGLNDILIKGNLAFPFNEYLDADPQWKAEMGDDAIQFNSRDGKVWSISKNRMLITYFYNKEYFAKANIVPAKTWDEFLTNCQKLKDAGITPLALMTNEDSWTTALFLASYVGTANDAGNELMNTKQLKNFDTPEFIEGLKIIKTMLKDYTTADALGANYSNAANNFLQGKAAIIANGPWMIPDFSDTTKTAADFDKNVGTALFPGSGIFSAFEVGYMVCSKDKETRDAAVKFIKFFTDANAQKIKLELSYFMPMTAGIQPSEEFAQKNPLFMDIIKLGGEAKYKYMDFGTTTYANINDAFKNLYPELLYDKITPEEMAKKMNEIAAKN